VPVYVYYVHFLTLLESLGETGRTKKYKSKDYTHTHPLNNQMAGYRLYF